MNLHDAAAVLPQSASFLGEPWSALDDGALLAHLRSPRQVQVDLVVDADECTSEKIAAVMQGHFEFNGETYTLADPIDWLTNPSADVEWHILLHKFYYAAGLGQAFLTTGDVRYAQRWAALLDSWMRVTPAGFIAADVTGRRVQNWIYSSRAFIAHDAVQTASLDAGFVRRLLESLSYQVDFLCQNLTAKRNHRTLELYAIFLAGVAFPEMRRAAYWREFALRETLANMQADLQVDGVHCEQSTDYHHLALRNWLHVRTLATRNGIPVPPQMDILLERALHFSMHVHKPDGLVPSFSDGDVRSFLPLLMQGAQIFGRADMRFVASQGVEGLPPASCTAHFPVSGYHVLRSAWSRPPHFTDAQHLVFDCGPLGEGNHGHFDALSFELAAYGRSLIVDPGRYTYSEAGDTNWRLHFRSTAAHNTVCLDGRSQTSYVPKVIKEASRHAQGAVRHKISGPAPETQLIESASSSVLGLLHGRCASYEYDAVHDRCIVFVDQRYWIVSDWMRASSTHDYVLNFQLGPEAENHAQLSHQAGVLLCSPGLVMAQPLRKSHHTTLAGGWVSTRYGHKQAAPVLRTQARGQDIDFDTVLLPSHDKAPALQVIDLLVQGEGGIMQPALRITLQLDNTVVVDGWFHARHMQSQRWKIGPYAFFGRWLYWREASDGSMDRAVSHAGATLHGPEGPVQLMQAQGDSV
jgi:uncharacterized heparinase superfamily protein